MPSTPLTIARKGISSRGFRSLGPAAVAAVVIILGGAAAADAATGGNFILGSSNTETSTAKLSNSNGIPLKLSAPAGTAPLEVNRSTMVNNLNAQYVGGLSGSQVAETGGYGFAGTAVPINIEGEIVASTGPLPAGTYYVMATAQLNIAAGDGGGFCLIQRESDGENVAQGGASQEGYTQAAEMAAVQLSAGDGVFEWCYSGGSNGSTAYEGAITAIRILNSSGATPFTVGQPSQGSPRPIVPLMRPKTLGDGPDQAP